MPTSPGRAARMCCSKASHELNVRVEDLDVEALGLQVRGDVKQPQRRVGLHHLQLVRVFVEKVAVGEENVHHDSFGCGFSRSTIRFSTGAW